MTSNINHTYIILAIMMLLTEIVSGCAAVYQPPPSFVADQQSKPGSFQEQAGIAPEVSTEKTNPSPLTDNESRKIHYDGKIELLVTNTRATIDKIVDLVNARNGYVEHISEDEVIVQVPAESFDAAFKEILTFGKILRKVITTVDITEQYRSTELRLKIAKSTRDRLMALLAKATSEEDKLQLLKQIEAITATIQSLESQFELLKTKVNFSKISVRLQTYDQFDSRYRDFEPLGFDWINDLAPLDDSIARAGHLLAFKEPPGMLHIKNIKQYWLAESGDKVLFRASERANNPKGDGDFWLDAIKMRLSPKYKSVEQVKVGSYELLRLESFDAVPAIYYVGIKVDKDAVKLVELYFPSPDLEDKYKKSIFGSVRAGET